VRSACPSVGGTVIILLLKESPVKVHSDFAELCETIGRINGLWDDPVVGDALILLAYVFFDT